jgi:hypothetical protein
LNGGVRDGPVRGCGSIAPHRCLDLEAHVRPTTLSRRELSGGFRMNPDTALRCRGLDTVLLQELLPDSPR